MHPAWLINDIWRLLLKHLTPKDLGLLAQTCRALSDIALQELWRDVTSFEPFLRCLPPDYRSRPLHRDDLERLDFYAAKIMIISLDGKSVDTPIRLPLSLQSTRERPRGKKAQEQEGNDHKRKIWEEVWEEIVRLRPTSGFLPNLRVLRINNADERYLLPLVGITGDHLKHVYIKYLHSRQSPSLVTTFLDYLKDVNNLDYLFVRDGQDLIPPRVISQAPLKHIRLDPRIYSGRHDDFHFKTFPLRPEVLHKDTLEHLTIGLTREWYTSDLKLGDRKYLQNMKTLWLNLTTFANDEHHEASIRSPVDFLETLDQP